jgi:hypothetical protein
MKRFITLVALVVLAACSPAAKVTKMPVNAVQAKLVDMESPPFVFGNGPPGMEDMGGPKFALEEQKPNALVWVVSQEGTAFLKFQADLTAVDPQSTSIAVKVSGATPEIQANIDKQPQIANLYLLAVTERIEATLEDRAFEMSRLNPAIAAATAANMGKINANFDEAAKNFKDRDRENMLKAYEKAGFSR